MQFIKKYTNVEDVVGFLSFLKIMKELTLSGFYTTEEIGKNVLAYDPIPSEHIACMPLNDQNAWNE